MNATHSQREQFVADLIRACPLATASTCQRLLRLGEAYERLSPFPVSNERAQGRRVKILTRAMNLCQQIGVLIIPTTGRHRLGIMVKGNVISIPTS